MNPKKILIFSLAYYPKHVGGAEVAIKEITDRIDSEDFEFHLITMRFSKSTPTHEQIGNVYVHRIGFGIGYIKKILFIPYSALYARRLHKKECFDGAWAMMTYMLFPIVLLRFLGIKLPYALTLQDGDPFEHVFKRFRIRLFLPLLRSGFKNASAVQTISSFLATWAQRFEVSGPVVVIPNGVSIKFFSTPISEEKRAQIRKQYGYTDDTTVLVSTSRLVYKNAYDDVIRALSALPEHVCLLVIGQGDEEQKLRTLSKTLGVQERVQFMGHAEYVDIPNYLHASDIFIRPSRSEGMGNSFIEAMAAGIPVIATQVGGLSDFIFDQERNPDKDSTAWVVEPDTPEDIVRAVNAIEKNGKEANERCENAKKYIRNTYEWDTVAQRMKKEVFAIVTS